MPSAQARQAIFAAHAGLQAAGSLIIQMARTPARTRAPYRETKRLSARERTAIILSAAKSIIVREGFSKFSLRYTAEKSGIRLATLQYYFPTKKRLFRAVFEDALREEGERIKRLIRSSDGSAEGILRARVSGQFRANLREETAGFFYQLWARARLDEFAAELVDEFYERNVETVAGMIGEVNPAISAPEAKRRATLVMAVLEGMMLLCDIEKRRSGEFESAERYVVDAIVRIVSFPAVD